MLIFVMSMKAIAAFFTIRKSGYIYLAVFLLFFPALLINLGKMPLLADEPTRALVALEMYFSDNYIVPTINGDYYYNKPPLYNWLLAGLYHISGRMDEWIVRLPTVVSICLFAGILFFYIRRYVNIQTAVLVLLAYVTCGRVLFYDSFLGLIDTLFSALIFMNWMVLYHYDKKGNYLKMFLYSYLIITACYFMKGLPALVFQFISLLTLAVLRKRIGILFLSGHFMGIALFLISCIFYYSQYLQFNSLEVLMSTLLNESTKRTVTEHGLMESIVHVLLFPFETVMHFLPWTAPLFLLFKKENREYIMKNDFLKFNLFMLLANIVVYWLSPETRPRYLFMFLPPVFLLSFALLELPGNVTFRKVMEKIFLVIIGVMVLAILVVPFIPMIPNVSNGSGKVLFLMVLLGMALVFYLRNSAYRLYIFGIVLLIARIGFDWFVFPSRLQTEPQVAYRSNSIHVGQLTKGEELWIYKHTPVNHDVSFYISRERGKILSRSLDKPGKGVFYLTDILDEELAGAKVYKQFHMSYNNTLLYLVRIEE